ncbi:MAG: hypothetical protein AAGI53_12985 [Planctomycetota bacterium]
MPRSVLLILVNACCLLSGCVANKQYNTLPVEYLTEVIPVTEGTVGVDLAIIEFDEFGMLWDRDQLEDAIALIERRNEESERGIVVFTYTHGWMNNADQSRSQSDLTRFRGWISGLAGRLQSQGDSAPEHVVGVYLAWRGATTRLPLVSTATFWDRRRTAERVASYPMLETLIRIKTAGQSRPDSKVIVSGHSMGGLILTKTLAPSLNALLLHQGEGGVSKLTNMLVTHNPAFDGLSTYQFIEYLKLNGVTAELRTGDGSAEPAPGPIMLSITSEADWVTRIAYPAGQIVGHRSTNFRSDLGGNTPAQGYLATRALGHVDHLISHRAWIEDGEVKLERVPGAYNDTPYWIVQVSEEICRDHGDIFNNRYNELYRRILHLNRIFEPEVQTWVRRRPDKPLDETPPMSMEGHVTEPPSHQQKGNQ